MSIVSDEAGRKTRLSPFIKQCIVTTAVFINNLVHGCGMAFTAVLLPQLRSTSSTIKLSSEQESWTASIIPVAMFAGNLLTVPAMRRGRKLTLYLVSLLNITGWIVITLASDFKVLIIGRFVQGMSIGLLLPVISVILGEYTSPTHRGMFLTTISFGQASGVLFIHLVGSFFGWQDMALFLSFFGLVSFAIIVFTPESPSWLALEGRYDECRKAFRWLRGHRDQEELNKMIQARQHFDSQAEKRSVFLEMMRAMTKKELYLPLAIGAFLYIVMASCGSVILANYVNVIAEDLMGPGCKVVVWMGVLDTVRLLSNIAAMYVVTRFRRRTLLFTTGAACVLSHFAISAYMYAKGAGVIYPHTWIPAVFLICQVVSLGIGAMNIPFVILGEIFPLQYRGLCGFLCNIVMLVGMFVQVKTFPGLRGQAGIGGAWLVYGGTVGLALLVVAPILPETKGRTLQDIEEHFRGRPLVPDDPEARALKGTLGETIKLPT